MTGSQSPLVLVVDDEEPIRQMERRILEKDGYRVIEAGNGADGVAMLKDGKTIELLIADLDMPEMGGEEMVRRIRTARPDLKVLYVTAHIDKLLDVRQRHGVLGPCERAGLGHLLERHERRHHRARAGGRARGREAMRDQLDLGHAAAPHRGVQSRQLFARVIEIERHELGGRFVVAGARNEPIPVEPFVATHDAVPISLMI